MSRSLSVIIPAFNEEKKIKLAVETVIEIVKKFEIDYELLIFDDGSTDQTGAILDGLTRDQPKMILTHHSTNQGLGVSTREAIEMSSKQYMTWFPGDNSVHKESFEQVICSIGEADLIIAYMSNNYIRPILRRVISRSFTIVMNILFLQRMKYYNGTTVFPVQFLRSCRLISKGFEFTSEMLIRCLKSGLSYKEIPFIHKTDNEVNSKALRLKNLWNVMKTTAILFKDVYIVRNPKGC